MARPSPSGQVAEAAKMVWGGARMVRDDGGGWRWGGGLQQHAGALDCGEGRGRPVVHAGILLEVVELASVSAG